MRTSEGGTERRLTVELSGARADNWLWHFIFREFVRSSNLPGGTSATAIALNTACARTSRFLYQGDLASDHLPSAILHDPHLSEAFSDRRSAAVERDFYQSSYDSHVAV